MQVTIKIADLLASYKKKMFEGCSNDFLCLHLRHEMTKLGNPHMNLENCADALMQLLFEYFQCSPSYEDGWTTITGWFLHYEQVFFNQRGPNEHGSFLLTVDGQRFDVHGATENDVIMSEKELRIRILEYVLEHNPETVLSFES